MALLLLFACIPVLTSPDLDSETGVVGEWIAPTNSWPTATPPEGLEEEGFDDGEVIPDFRMLDQYGEEVALWQFYGRVVALDFSTMWCGPCQNLAEGVQEFADTYREQGFTYITALPEDVDGDLDDPAVPDQDDLNAWADFGGITEPILSDADGYAFRAVPNKAWPVIYVVDRDLKVVTHLASPSEAEVIEAVQGAL